MAGIQLSGLVSGLDTQSLITQLMAVEKLPRTKITTEQSQVTKRQGLLQDIATKLTTLKGTVDDLKSAATWADTQTVTSADETKLGVARTAGAPPGGFDVRIVALASAERRTYSFQPPAAAGPLKIYAADGTTLRASVDLKAGATVDDAVAAINASTDAKLYAVNVNGDLVLSARTTGAGSGFVATGAGTETQRIAGTDADIFIGAVEYKRSTNVITDALPGVTLTLKGKTAGTDTVGVTVGNPGPDQAAIVANVKAFADAYNALVTTTRADLSEKRVPNASTTSDATKGTLFGDTGLNGMLTSLRGAVAATVAGMPAGLASLADLGISTGAATTGTGVNADAVAGRLTVDTAKLTTALNGNPLGVRKLLGGQSGVDGFAQAFGAVLTPFQGADGTIAQRVTSAGSDLTRISTRLTQFDNRMDMKQTHYQRQFTALETALQKSQSVGTSLAGYLNTRTTG
jgi:flagellar hook-associated protein 2